MIEKYELKPCPECGSEANLETEIINGIKYYRVICSKNLKNPDMPSCIRGVTKSFRLALQAVYVWQGGHIDFNKLGKTLKPCPFCGSQAKFAIRDEYDTQDPKLFDARNLQYFNIGCFDEGGCFARGVEANDIMDAIDAWNKRSN